MMEIENETPVKQESNDQKLDRIYNALEQQWNTIKHRRKRTIRANSVDARPTLLARQLLDDSPRVLLSSLQKGRSALSDGHGSTKWKVRNNDLAVLEILKERRTAMESGNLKGRRLFDDETEKDVNVVEMDFGDGTTSVGSWKTGFVQENEVWSYDFDDESYGGGKDLIFCSKCCQCGRSYSTSSACSSSSSSPPVQVQAENEEEQVSVEIKEEKRVKTWEVVVLLIFVVFLVVAFLGFISIEFGGYVGKEMILVPT